MKERITQTELTTFSRCEERHRLRYSQRLVPLVEHPALSMGSAFHAGIEALDPAASVQYLRDTHGQSWDRWEGDDALVREAVVVAMVGGALAVWGEWPTQQEVQFEVPLLNPGTGSASKKHTLSGVLDGVWAKGEHPDHPGEVVIGEWKTASVVNRDYIQRLEMDFQVSTYLWAWSLLTGAPVRKAVYRVVKKPTIRQKKGESASDYAARVKDDYLNRPEHYFFEELVTRTDEQLAAWERQAWATHKRVLQIQRGNVDAIRNTQSCISRGRCPYFDLCVGAVTEDAFNKLPTKHRELREKSNGNHS